MVPSGKNNNPLGMGIGGFGLKLVATHQGKAGTASVQGKPAPTAK